MSGKSKRRFKHGTMVRFKVKSGRRILENRVIPIENLGGAITTVSYVYNREAISGGVSWWCPATGAPIARPQVTWDLVDPSDELFGNQLCDCEACHAA